MPFVASLREESEYLSLNFICLRDQTGDGQLQGDPVARLLAAPDPSLLAHQCPHGLPLRLLGTSHHLPGP
ncbi:hypothetical protein NDU88_000766 [Pleurodeles waltl]|uniref:Uncharacterized protein n=1 Tax=Pleurodeles waltl TaxID=8319 RepID=A0AAV7MSS9_PLEWA|nr:hypothetical protein NDU88_000766 [Pleurodeles waltl]